MAAAGDLGRGGSVFVVAFEWWRSITEAWLEGCLRGRGSGGGSGELRMSCSISLLRNSIIMYFRLVLYHARPFSATSVVFSARPLASLLFVPIFSLRSYCCSHPHERQMSFTLGLTGKPAIPPEDSP